MFRAGDTVFFRGYCYPVEPIFVPGDVIRIEQIDAEGAFRCYLVDHLGEIVAEEGDTVFAEEITLLLSAPYVACAPQQPAHE